MTKLFLFFALIVPPASGDTLVFTWNASVNGSVTFKDGRFTITGRFDGKQQSAEISPKDVAQVRFNSLEYNSGALQETPIPRAGITAPCEVVLQNGATLQAGTLVAIDKVIRTSPKRMFDKNKVTVLRMLHP